MFSANSSVRTVSRVALEETPAPGAWVERAACRALPTDWFFSDDSADSETARAVCRPCPVRNDCAAYALVIPGIGGIWGGLSEADRRRIRGGDTLVSKISCRDSTSGCA